MQIFAGPAAGRVFWFSIVFGLLLAPVLALGSAPASAPRSPDPSIGLFLDAEGRLDMERVRRWGYEGPINTAGFKYLLDDESSRPMFRPQDAVAGSVDDANWSKQFYLPGLNWFATDFVVFNQKLVAGGFFEIAGNSPSSHIAQWDGTQWLPLGRGMNDNVTSVAVYKGELYAGGWFTVADGKPASYIAKWDGSSWVSVGGGVDNDVIALEVYGDYLVAGGLFLRAGSELVNHVAKWDGTAWSAFGTGVDGLVIDIGVFEDNLYIGGAFTQAGNDPVNYIARWDGASWVPLGSGVNTWVNAMIVYNSSLIVGGDFTQAGSVQLNHIGRWDGTSWHPLGAGTSGGVIDVDVFGNRLIAAGDFSKAGGISSIGLAAWDGAGWSTVGDGINDGGVAIGEYQQELVVSGFFTLAGDPARNPTPVDFIARLDKNDDTWKPVADRAAHGVNDRVETMAFYNGDLIVGGRFTSAGSIGASGIARWDGTQFHPMSTGVHGAVFTVNVLSDGLYIGGVFDLAGGHSARSIAKWDGTTWLGIGEGFDFNQQAGAVNDIEEFRGKIYAGGLFNNSGSRPMRRVARWDGSAWRELGTDWVGSVLDLTVFGDELLACGTFSSLGDPSIAYVASWNGREWGSTYGVFNKPVFALLPWGSDLVAAGSFGTIDQTPYNLIARWNGTNWFPMGDGFTQIAFALAIHRGDLIAGGQFLQSGTTQLNGVGRWNGTSWEPLGSGLGGVNVPEAAALASDDNNLFVGGFFGTAGDARSSFIAEWSEASTPVVLASFTAQRQGASAVVEWEVAGDGLDRASFHVYRSEPGGDRQRISRELLTGQTRYRFEDTAPPPGAAQYWLAEIGRRGFIEWHGPVTLEPAVAGTPVLALTQNHPNPFSQSTRITYEIPAAGPVRLSIFDVSGREIARPVDTTVPAGRGEVEWNGKTRSGEAAPAGVYWYRIRTDRGTRIKQLIKTQ